MPSTSSLQTIPTGTKVLVVDDHADTVDFLARLLRKAGCAVTTATGLRDAEARLDAEKFDVIVSDLGLADGSGIDLMRQSRQRHAIKGIALSGSDSPEERRQCEEAGFCEHIAKPVDMPKLLQAIQRTLNS